MQDHRADYTLPVLTSRRGIVQGLLGFSGIFALLSLSTGNAHLGDAAVVGLGAAVLLAVTPSLRLGHPIIRFVVPAPLYVPLFLAAFLESSLTMALLLAAIGLEVLVFCFLFLQEGKANLTVRGLQRRRLLTNTYSFDDMAGVTRFNSHLGTLLREAGFGSTSVEIQLYSTKRVRLNVARAEVEGFIEQIQNEIDPSSGYDMFFLESVEVAADEPEPIRPAKRRGRRPKQPADPEPEAPQIPSVAR